jgi:peptidoglycan/LPS O-acetylase OafA/YrhL
MAECVQAAGVTPLRSTDSLQDAPGFSVPSSSPDAPSLEESPQNRALPSNDRLIFLDGLRGLLAIMVFIGHVDQAMGMEKWVGPFQDAFVVAGYRVPAFFALSGFVQYLSSANLETVGMKVPLKVYFQRRARRLLPAYYASLLFVLILCFSLDASHLKHVRLIDGEFCRGFFSHVFFAQSWQEKHWFNGALWMMGYEWVLSLLLPFILLLANRVGWIGVCGGMSLLLLPQFKPLWFWTAPNLMLPFLFGIMAARAARRLKDSGNIGSLSIRTIAASILGASFLAFLPLIPAMNERTLHPATVAGILARVFAGLTMASFCVYLTMTSKGWWAKRFSQPTIVKFGRISYSFFLVHCPIIKLMAWCVDKLNHATSLPIWVFFAATFPLSFGLATLFYRWFEAPFIGSGAGAVRGVRFPELLQNWQRRNGISGILPVQGKGTRPPHSANEQIESRAEG